MGHGGIVALRTLACAAVFVSAASAQQRVPLVLNHLRIVLDSATYHDMRNSPFILGQFAAIDSGFLMGFDGGEGIRLMGKYNFLTLAPPSGGSHAQMGDVAIVLATTRVGDLALFSKQGSFHPQGAEFIQPDGPPRRPEQYIDMGDRRSPAGPDLVSDRVNFAVMEYSPARSHERAQIDSLPESNLAGSRFLAPFFDPKRLFSYLTGATLAIPVDDIKKISRVLERDSIAVIAEGEGAIIKLDGFTLHLVPSFVGAGVKQLQFALTRTALGNPIYQFGQKSQLRFGPGPIAVWNFNWP